MRSVLLTLKKSISIRDKPLPTSVQVLFFHRLSHILKKGYPLLEALYMTGWDKKLKPVSRELSVSLKNGEAIDLAFKKASFSPIVTNFLFFGRVHDDLPLMFQQCEEMLRLKTEYIQKILQVLRYPCLLFIFIFLAFGIMKQTILPNFIMMFQNEHSNALWIMYGVNYFINGLLIFGVLCLLCLLILKVTLPKWTIEKKANFYEKIVLFRIYQKFSLSLLFTTHLHSLLKSGLPMKQSLEIMSAQTHYDLLSHYCRNILKQLSTGHSLGQAIHSCTLLRKELTEVFHDISDVRAVEDELDMLRNFYIESIKEKLTKWIQFIQPAFFIFIAVLVICIYASIMLPLYQWMNQI